jgi:hypothetical protein
MLVVKRDMAGSERVKAVGIKQGIVGEPGSRMGLSQHEMAGHAGALMGTGPKSLDRLIAGEPCPPED